MGDERKRNGEKKGSSEKEVNKKERVDINKRNGKDDDDDEK